MFSESSALSAYGTIHTIVCWLNSFYERIVLRSQRERDVKPRQRFKHRTNQDVKRAVCIKRLHVSSPIDNRRSGELVSYRALIILSRRQQISITLFAKHTHESCEIASAGILVLQQAHLFTGPSHVGMMRSAQVKFLAFSILG